MRILQVIHDFLPKHQAGSELYCFHLSKALQSMGHDVRLFYSEIDHEHPAYSVRQGEFEGLPFWEIVNNHGYSSFQETYENPSVEKAFAECLDAFRPEVVHYHHLLGLSYGCVRACKEKGIPVVFTLHDYWLTCPRGGGQRFLSEDKVCLSVDRSLCAECISRYSFGASKGARLVKKILSWFDRPGTDLITRIQKGRVTAPKRSFVSRGQCDIYGDIRDVLYAHPPTKISCRLSVPPESELVFSIAMPPSVYEQSGDGVRFLIHCNDELIYEKFLHPKQNKEDRGWHPERIPLDKYAGNKQEFVFETQAYPTGKIDFCTACWSELKMTGKTETTYQPSVQSKFQNTAQRFLHRFQQKSLQVKVDKRTQRTHELFNDVDLFIAPSQFLRSKFIEYGMSPDKIIFSDYGILTDGYKASPQKPETPVRFTFIGTLVVHKGLHVLIEAFNRLPQDAARLNVYGNTGEFTDYVKRIKTVMTHPGISLCGRAENQDIPRILSETDVLVVPSIWFENSPITIHEAFLAKVPVITSRFGGMADLVKDGKNGLLFEMGDANSLHKCLQKCTQDPSYINTIRPKPEEVKTIATDAKWMEETYKKIIT